jgi:hypothetical protein
MAVETAVEDYHKHKKQQIKNKNLQVNKSKSVHMYCHRQYSYLKERYFLKCDTMWSGRSWSAFLRNVLPPSSGLKNIPSETPVSGTCGRHCSSGIGLEGNADRTNWSKQKSNQRWPPKGPHPVAVSSFHHSPHCLQPVTLQVLWSYTSSPFSDMTLLIVGTSYSSPCSYCFWLAPCFLS